jgi:hypothetical protein
VDVKWVSTVVTIALGFIGLAGTYLYNLRLARRKDRLELINLQLNQFYGPLYVSTVVGAIAFDALRRKLRRELIFANRFQPDPEGLREWKIWLPNVFLPLNEFRGDLILTNSHLIREQDMPECLLAFVAHAAAYKAVLKKWEEGDFSEFLSIIDFPADLEKYATRSYQELKREQLQLLGRRGN